MSELLDDAVAAGDAAFVRDRGVAPSSALDRRVTRVALDLGEGAPIVAAHGVHVTALVLTPARRTAELAALEEERHALAPRWWRTHGEDVLVLPRAGAPCALPAIDAGALETTRGARSRLLEELAREIDLLRALRRVARSRRALENWLAEEEEILWERGPDLGGIAPRAVVTTADRVSAGGAMALTVRRARRDGYPALDHARAAIETWAVDRGPLLLPSTSPSHAAGRRLLALALVLREIVLGRRATWAPKLAAELDGWFASTRALAARGPSGGSAREPRDAGASYELHVEGPAWLVTYGGARSPVARDEALAWLRELDGRTLGGVPVRVTTTPSLARPPRPPLREPERARRLRLFGRFYDGIRFDDEGLYSATPEALADVIAAEAEGAVLDGTAGIGALSIALARAPRVTSVVAVDREPSRLSFARHNAEVYGVGERIAFRASDAWSAAEAGRFDTIVLDPPWGGRDYDREDLPIAALGMDLTPFFALPSRLLLKLPKSARVHELPADLEVRPLFDARGVLKCLLAIRAARRA